MYLPLLPIKRLAAMSARRHSVRCHPCLYLARKETTRRLSLECDSRLARARLVRTRLIAANLRAILPKCEEGTLSLPLLLRVSRDDDAPDRATPGDTTHIDADRKLEDGARHATYELPAKPRATRRTRPKTTDAHREHRRTRRARGNSSQLHPVIRMPGLPRVNWKRMIRCLYFAGNSIS